MSKGLIRGMGKKTASILLVFTPLLAFWPCLLSSNQEAQKPPPAITQFGVPSAGANPAQIPAGSRPPDRLFQPGSTSAITALALSPDGQWLASGGYNQSIIVWNVATGAEQSRLPRPRLDDPLAKLAFSPDGSSLASASLKGEVQIWNYLKGTIVCSVSLRGGYLMSFTYAPDGKIWAASVNSAGERSTARIEIHDAARGRLLRTFPTRWDRVAAMTITSGGILVASGATGEDVDENSFISAWNLASGQLVKSSEVPLTADAIDADGRLMACIDLRGQAKVVISDFSSGQVKQTISQPSPGSPVFSPDGETLAVASGSDYGLDLVSVMTGATIHAMQGADDPGSPGRSIAAFSADGKRMAATAYPPYSLKVWDKATGREVRAFCGQRSVVAVAISPDGQWLVSAGAGVAVLDPATGKVVTTLTSEAANKVIFSSDGRWLAANAGRGAGAALKIWEVKTWSVVASVTPERDPRQNTPVQWIAFGGPQSSAGRLGSAQSLQFTADGETHTVWFGVSPLAVTPDGKSLVELGYPLNNVDLWDTNSGQKLQTFAAHKMSTDSLAFSSDGHWLLTVGQESLRRAVDFRTFTGSTEFSVKVWDVATWTERASISFPRIRPGNAVFLPQGHGLAVERSGEVIELLDVDGKTSLGILAATDPQPGYYPPVNRGNLAVNSDGTLLFQGAKNGIRVWKLQRR